MFFENLFSSLFLNIGLFFLFISIIGSLIITLLIKPRFKFKIKAFIITNLIIYFCLLVSFKHFYYDHKIENNNLSMIKYISLIIDEKEITKEEYINLKIDEALNKQNSFDIVNYVNLQNFKNFKEEDKNDLKNYVNKLKTNDKTIVMGDYFFLSFKLDNISKQNLKETEDNNMKLITLPAKTN